MTHLTRRRQAPLARSVALGLAAISVTAIAQAALSAPRDAHVAFEAAGPAGMKIEGSTSELKIDEADGNVTIDVPLANLVTGIALRDRHMREKYLEVQKFPDAVLVVTRSALKIPASGARAEADAPGTLKLHGQVRPVTVHYDATADGDGLLVHGAVHVKMDDYGIALPSYLGVTVKPDVDVRATFHVSGT
jgi:polyisoprenoid-binding protein YceI